ALVNVPHVPGVVIAVRPLKVGIVLLQARRHVRQVIPVGAARQNVQQRRARQERVVAPAFALAAQAGRVAQIVPLAAGPGVGQVAQLGFAAFLQPGHGRARGANTAVAAAHHAHFLRQGQQERAPFLVWVQQQGIELSGLQGRLQRQR
ncbi:hypothetical protein RZS08_21750, partial [Arthrospira platensis SPKY1]|nr:hypothetical protein [Arthrospira platensis SPKY1]